MAFSLLKVKSIFNSKRSDRLEGSGSQEPEIGFKAIYNKTTNCVHVTLIGARHLPSLFGLSSAKGYVAKVKLFPGDLKFETQLQDTSWPVWNEEFKFPLNVSKNNKKTNEVADISQLSGRFVSLTIYAVLETKTTDRKQSDKKKQPDAANSHKESENNSTLAKFEKIVSSSFKRSDKSDESSTSANDKRRTVGAATWKFDLKIFQNDLRNNTVGTPDIWRPIEQIGSGLAPSPTAMQDKKGQVEVSITYSSSEDGCNDTIQVTVNKMKCSIATMQEHEIHKEPLYIKASISDGINEKHWKSDRFFPTISARWDPKTSCARHRFDSKKLSNIIIYISLGCKNSMAIKENLGKVAIGEKVTHSDMWKKIIATPGLSVTQWLPFE